MRDDSDDDLDVEEARASAAEAYGLDELAQQAVEIVIGAFDLFRRDGAAALESGPVDTVALALSDGRVAEVVGDAIARAATPAERAEVAAFAELLLTPGGRTAAGAHHLRARVAEWDGDALAGERHLTLALASDPHHEPSLADAAWYAEDRGDARRAIDLLRRFGPGGDGHIARIRRWQQGDRTAPGRNQPCPCGSGRKYKLCCATQGGTLASRSGWLYEKAVAFAHRPPQRDPMIEVACALAGVAAPDEDPEAFIDAVQDPLVHDLVLFEGGVLDAFVAERGPLLPVDERDLAASWSGSRRRLYRVADVRPGRGLTLHDLLSDEEVDVDERRGSMTVQEGARLYTRVLTVAGTQLLFGPVIELRMAQADALLPLLDAGAGAVAQARWMHDASGPPTLTNTDGEPLELWKGRVKVPDLDRATEALARQLEDDGEGAFSLLDATRTVKGHVQVEGGLLVLEANSRARYDALVALVAALVPGAAVVEEERADPRARADAGVGGLEMTPELEAVLDAHLAEMEERWTVEPVPALGGLTPTEALADPDARARLVDLLAEFDRHQAAAPPGARGFDPGHLRDLLGLARPDQVGPKARFGEVDHDEVPDALHADPATGEFNLDLHLALHEVVGNQLAEDDPPETWEAAQRLVHLGYHRHEVLHMLASAVSDELFQLLQDKEPFDRERFLHALDALPLSWENQRPGSGPARPHRRERRTRRPR